MSDTNNNNQITSNAPSTSGPAKTTRLAVIRKTTQETLESLSPDDLKSPDFVEGAVLYSVNAALDLENSVREQKDKWKPLTELMNAQIADILAYSYPIVRIAGADMNVDAAQDMLAIYQYDGDDKGLYVSSDTALRKLVRSYNYNTTIRDMGEVVGALQEQLPRVSVCKLPNLVAVNNGIFDYDTKQLLDFDPSHVFLSKSRVDYNPNATNVTIHNDSDGTDWDVESWMADLSDDPDIVEVLWQILGAIIRPHVAWDKSAWFYSESGNNGKGTLCELMKQLCGEGSYASISLADFSKDFALEPLTRVTAIIVDENDVGTYIDKAANLKAVITGDTISINRKFKTPIAYKYRGFMVQCLNEMPRIKDRSNSFFRRQLFVPFTKCFTGKERKYIKHDYLRRKEVLEYVLHRVLHMDYYELSVPQACVDALDEYKSYVDPIRAFLEDVMPRVKWNLLPAAFMYELYKCWYSRNIGNDRSLKSNIAFGKEVKALIDANYPAWSVTGKSPKKTSSLMELPEPMIMEYNVKTWMNTRYLNTGDVDKICRLTSLAGSYRGYYRIVPQDGSDEDVFLRRLASGDDSVIENESKDDTN